MHIPEIPAQHNFVSAMSHAYSNAHKPPKTVAPARIIMLTEMYCSHQYLLIQKKVLHAHFTAHKLQKTIKDKEMGSQI